MKITVSESDREVLEKWLKSRSVGQKQKQRAKIVLGNAEGMSTEELIEEA